MAGEEFVMVDESRSLQPKTPTIFQLPKLNGYDLFEVTVDELQHLYSSGAFTSEEYTQLCLDRIQAVNPYLEAVIETNPAALAIARWLDYERQNSRVREPLHGIPVLVKDVGVCQFLLIDLSLSMMYYLSPFWFSDVNAKVHRTWPQQTACKRPLAPGLFSARLYQKTRILCPSSAKLVQ